MELWGNGSARKEGGAVLSSPILCGLAVRLLPSLQVAPFLVRSILTTPRLPPYIAWLNRYEHCHAGVEAVVRRPPTHEGFV